MVELLQACEVWWAGTALDRPGHLALLTDVERERRERLRRDEDRTRFTLGAVLLRLAVAGALDLPPGEVTIDRACPRCAEPHGRPRVPGDPVHVSVSHSGEWVAVAVYPDAPVGVDVELIRPIDTAGMAGLVLAPGEQADSLEEFYTHWTRKESVVKATGDGLRVSMSGVRLDAAGKVTSYPGRPELTASVVDLAPRPGYAAALTVLAASHLRVRERDAAELLST